MSQNDDPRFGTNPAHSAFPSSHAPGRTSALPGAPARSSLEALADSHVVSAIDLTQVAILLEHLEVLPRDVAERHLILPVALRDDRLFVAMANPSDRRAIDELEFVSGKRVEPYVAPARLLARVLDAAYQAKERGARHYTGPNCPPQVLSRLRHSAAPPPPSPSQARSSLPPPAPLPPPKPRSTTGQAGRGLSRELSDDGFGTLSADLSTVTDLSVLGKLAAAGGTPELAEAKTILVVDSDVEIRRMLARTLSERGHRVIEADRGLSALRLVKERIPDLIILDATLPELHGFDIAKRIKGSGMYGHIPIVMMSAMHRGWRYAEDVKASCGVTEYVEKPFRMAEMHEAIERALSSAEPVDPKSERTPGSAQAEQALADGIAAYKAGDLEAAIAHLRRGVTIDPLAYRLRYHLGLLLGRRGLIYEGIEALEIAVGINARHFPALKNLAVLYEKAGFRNKAIETWERSIAAAPDDAMRQSIKEYLVGLL